MQITKLKNIILLLVILSSGMIAGGFLTVYHPINFSKEIAVNIDPTNIFSILITIFLALYVTEAINKTNEIERIEKDLLIKNISEHKDNIQAEISKLITSPDLLIFTVNERMKTIIQKTESFFLISKEANLAKDYEPKDLMGVLKDFRILFTDTCADTSGIQPVKISKNKITLSDVRKQELFQNLNKLDQEVHRLVRKINRS